MDCNITTNYFKEKIRMLKPDGGDPCTISCSVCPFSKINNGISVECDLLEAFHIEKAIAIVQKWSDEHPRKSYKDDFLEKFPNACLNEVGQPHICRKLIYGYADCTGKSCFECWADPIPD